MNDVVLRNKGKTKRVGIVCIEDGLTFKSISECARHYGISRVQLSYVLNGHRKGFGNCDKHFRRTTDDSTVSLGGLSSYFPKVKVLCVEDGLAFKSLTECAKHYGIHREQLSFVLNGQRKGFRNCTKHFKRVGDD